MTENKKIIDDVSKSEFASSPELDPTESIKTMPQIENRFLYVDVASRRAKQLRRGALPRLKSLAAHPETGERPTSSQTLERIAMQEVSEGLIVYKMPGQNSDS